MDFERDQQLIRESLASKEGERLARALIELLRKKRAGDESDELNYVLAATISGISAGLGIPARR